jgi:hypothetical protein
MKTKILSFAFLLFCGYSYSQVDMKALKTVIYDYKHKYSGYKMDSLVLSLNDDVNRIVDTKKLIYISSLNFAGEFSLAQSMANVANNMKIFEDDEAYKIDKLTTEGEKIFNTAADVISLLGGVATVGLMVSNNKVTKNTQLAVNLSAIIPQVIKFIAKERNENKRIDKAIEYAHTKAARLSINAYLSIEIKSISKTLETLKNQSLNISDKSKGDLNKEDLVKLSKEYISLVENIDRFYNFDIMKLKNSITERAGFKIYPDLLQTQLDNLASSIESNNKLWQERRFNYLESTSLLKNYTDQ